MRDKIWAALVDLKFKSYCISELVEKFQTLDRNINIFLVIASSGSIAAWAIWKIYPMIWGGIIALSQVLTVAKPYLPYNKFVKELNSKSLKIDILNIEFERLWYKSEYKKINEDEATEQYFDLRKQIVEILNFSDETIINVNQNIEKKCNEKMQRFLKNNYNISINLNQ